MVALWPAELEVGSAKAVAHCLAHVVWSPSSLVRDSVQMTASLPKTLWSPISSSWLPSRRRWHISVLIPLLTKTHLAQSPNKPHNFQRGKKKKNPQRIKFKNSWALLPLGCSLPWPPESQTPEYQVVNLNMLNEWEIDEKKEGGNASWKQH